MKGKSVEFQGCTRKPNVKKKTVPGFRRETTWTKYKKEPKANNLLDNFPMQVLDINFALLTALNNIIRRARDSEAHGHLTPIYVKYLLRAYDIQDLNALYKVWKVLLKEAKTFTQRSRMKDHMWIISFLTFISKFIHFLSPM